MATQIVNGMDLDKLEKIQELVHYSPVHGLVEYANSVEAKVSRA
jgi:hypothetical protein